MKQQCFESDQDSIFLTYSSYTCHQYLRSLKVNLDTVHAMQKFSQYFIHSKVGISKKRHHTDVESQSRRASGMHSRPNKE